MGKPRFVPPEICPICGADVHRNALACPDCGADEKSGWSQNAVCDGVDLPHEEFDYDKYVEKEFGSGKTRSPEIGWFWWVIAVIVLIMTGILLLHGR